MMNKYKIGSIFVKSGLISDAALTRALRENETRPKEKLGRTIARLRLADAAAVARTLSQQSNIPYIELNTIVIDPSAVRKIPPEVCMKHYMLPIYIERNNLVLAVEDPYDFEAIEAARFASGLNIRPHVAASSEIVDGIKRYHSTPNESTAFQKLQDAEPDEELEFFLKHLKPNEEQLDELKEQSQSPAIEKMINTIMFQGIAVRASAILFEPQQHYIQVKNRVNGQLIDSIKVEKTMQAALIAHFKILGGMDFTKRLIPQKGRTQYKMHQRMLELEISCLPAQYGESMIVQLLDTGDTVPVLNDLGLPSEDMMKIMRLLSIPRGMILVCGPPSSGKTATLYALAHEMSRHQRKIVTIEKAIEYQLKGANQVKIDEDIGLTYHKAFQSILRHNPDVIILGEIRDKETAESAMKASQEGRLIFSAVQADNILDTIARLNGLGVNPQLFASSLSGIITQRLVRKSCTKCRVTYQPSGNLLHKVETRAKEKLACEFLRGAGCQECNLTGYHDRFGVYHIVMMSQALSRVILQDGAKSSIGKIEKTLLMKSILTKVKQGETTLEELKRVLFSSKRPQQVALSKCQRCRKPVKEGVELCSDCRRQEQERQSAQEPSVEARVDSSLEAHAAQEPERNSTPPRPVSQAPQAEHVSESPRKEPAHVKSNTTQDVVKNCKVLIVDSDPKMTNHLSSALSEKHFHVITAADGQEALKKIIREKPHLILTESVLPKLDGLGLIRRLRKAPSTKSLPVMIVSSKGEIVDRIRGFAAGTDDYLPKPFSIHELFFRMNAILRRTYK